jgi:hypothetical protein
MGEFHRINTSPAAFDQGSLWQIVHRPPICAAGFSPASQGELSMIVRYESDGTIVMITQNDHALICGLSAAHWGNKDFPLTVSAGITERD